jgi:NADPH:quinone reductase-like Zn-dependent oxidoreductase
MRAAGINPVDWKTMQGFMRGDPAELKSSR